MDEPDAADGAVTALSISSDSMNDHDDTTDVFDLYSAACSTARTISIDGDHNDNAEGALDLYSAPCSTARSIPPRSKPSGPYFALSARSDSNASLHTPLLITPVQRSNSSRSLHTPLLITPVQRSDRSFGTAIEESDAEPRTANSVQRGPVSVITLSSDDAGSLPPSVISSVDCSTASSIASFVPHSDGEFDCSTASSIASFVEVDNTTASSIGSLVSLSDGEVDWYAGQYTMGSALSSPRALTIPPSPVSSVDSGEWPAGPGERGPSVPSKGGSPSPSTPSRRPTRAAAATARARIVQLLDD